jgi:hypothetical protein
MGSWGRRGWRCPAGWRIRWVYIRCRRSRARDRAQTQRQDRRHSQGERRAQRVYRRRPGWQAGLRQSLRRATAETRYAVGSISKQFTAAAILLLQEQHRLSLDDKVSKYFPALTRANESPSASCSPTPPAMRTTPRRITSSPPGPIPYAAGNPGGLGQKAAQFRPRHEVAIQQHQLRARRRDLRQKASEQKLLPFLKDRIFSR